MNKDNEISEKVQELQILEQNLQSLALQRQAFQFEITETQHALDETTKSDEGDVFKIVGQIMIKAQKKSVLEDLKRKKELMEIRIKSIDKQEGELSKRAEETRKEVEKMLSSKKK